MKLYLSIALAFILVALQVKAQPTATPDSYKTKKGTLVVQPITHGSVVLNFAGKSIYIDPYGGADLYRGLQKPDLILITDIHGDHLDKKTLDALETSSAIFIVPQAVADQLPEKYKNQVKVVANGKCVTELGLTVKAIPMYNLPESPDSGHTKGRGNGYILDLGGKIVYFSGDTEDIKEMRELKNIDIAFVCMNLPYTMDINQAASAVLDFKPNIVYPYHYRGTDGLSNVEAFKKLVNDSNKKIEVKLKDWYPKKK